MKENNGEHPFGDSGQLILLVLFLLIWVVDSFFLRISTFLSDDISVYIRLVILGLILVTAVYLIRSGHVVAKHEQGSTGVESTGAFQYVRHPLYLGSIMFYLGLAVSTASLFSIGLVVIIFFFYDYIASYEEKLLEDRCHEEYRNYKIKTGKWVPRIG
ncbi:MAG: isoprenylcysteine carboxylmethyltransferase family protein [Desulfobacteraceae bacterium]|jgi:protein-S-isoprenylcysteine O-methyltransferase Ste14|nr:isoprenylcysteine carboxylmethyltransferase family protein [Desulfobacteraceae bacterium]